MFLEDEFVIRRLRAHRVSISLLVALVAFAASILMTFGLVTTVYAGEQQTAIRADEQIVRGIVVLLAAMMAASGLAIWRRRVRGIFAGAKP